MTLWPINAGASPPHPRGWAWRPLTSVAELVTGHTPDRKRPDYWNGGISWVNLNEIRKLDGRVCCETELQISPAGVANSSAVVHPAGTVCLSRTASVGFVTIMGAPMATSQDFVNWICGPGLDPKYLMAALRASRPNILGMCSGSTHKTMYVRQAERLQVLLPPLEEQRRIAAILDKADELRAKRRAALERLDTLTQAIFLDMFGDPVTNSMGWPGGRPLGEVAEIVSGITKGRRTAALTREVPYLAVANVQDKRLEMSAIKSIEATEVEIERYRLRPGDVLLTEGGDPDKLGRGTVWREELPEAIHQNHIFRVRPNTTTVTPDFLAWLVGSERGKRYFLKSAKQTTGIASINATQLRAFPLLLPPLERQREFDKRVAQVRTTRVRADHADGELERLVLSLESSAFRGEL